MEFLRKKVVKKFGRLLKMVVNLRPQLGINLLRRKITNLFAKHQILSQKNCVFNKNYGIANFVAQKLVFIIKRHFLFWFHLLKHLLIMYIAKKILIYVLTAIALLFKTLFGIIQVKKSGELTLDVRALAWLVVIVVGTNLLTYGVRGDGSIFSNSNRLYLLDYAGEHVSDIDGFEEKVRSVGQKLQVPPEWLMAVMYSESKFNAGVKNHRGSGATGLIQFMPNTAKDFDLTVDDLRELNPVDQLDYVYEYLHRVRNRYGDYHSLTDLYLAILYPKALSGDFCYTLYAQPSTSYSQNSGLDENNDGRVTVKDIDKYLQRLFPTAYQHLKEGGIAQENHITKAGIGQ